MLNFNVISTMKSDVKTTLKFDDIIISEYISLLPPILFYYFCWLTIFIKDLCGFELVMPRLLVQPLYPLHQRDAWLIGISFSHMNQNDETWLSF